MSNSAEGNDKPPSHGEPREVLSSLPRHRPQRLTARREATRKAQSARAPARKPSADAPKAPRKAASVSPAKAMAKKTQPVKLKAQKPAPKQGFEIDEAQLGTSIEPPDGTEMILSALKLGGSLAQSGLSRGGTLLKGALGRLPRP
jgi:hypothetical protein